jgi:hypothetical protein
VADACWLAESSAVGGKYISRGLTRHAQLGLRLRERGKAAHQRLVPDDRHAIRWW